jgi:hypothetical protein
MLDGRERSFFLGWRGQPSYSREKKDQVPKSLGNIKRSGPRTFVEKVWKLKVALTGLILTSFEKQILLRKLIDISVPQYTKT